MAIGPKHATSLQKAVFLFSIDGDKVSYNNYVPKSEVSKNFNAKTWVASTVSIINGKGGGKDESATGVGSGADKVDEMIKIAISEYEQR